MKRVPRIGTTRALQIGVVGLFLTCFAQAAYWIADQVSYTRAVQQRILGEWSDDVAAAESMLAQGVSRERLHELFPHVELSADGNASIHPLERAALERERARRLNRYGWEGAFFLLVLLAGMAVIVQALRQRGELARRQQNFLAAVSHEFKSPLASLKLAAETLLLRRPEGEAFERVTHRMLLDVERLATMVTNLLEVAKIDEGRVALARERVRLADELRPLVDEANCRAHLRSVRIETDVPAELCALADAAALRTVLGNLVSNAVKSTAAKGGGAVRLSARAEGRDVRVDVRDDGLGFEPKEGPRLFEKFYRPGDELRRRTEGSGLGLYIVKHFVEQGGGRVAAQSEGPGRGALFSVWWPAATAEVAS